MHKTASSASAPTLRSARTTLDGKRRLLARGGKLNQVIAVESADDEEGFLWWLCKVSTPAFRHTGRETKTENGVVLKRGLWYLSIDMSLSGT